MKSLVGMIAVAALASQAGVSEIPASVRGKKPAADAVLATVGSEKVTTADVEDWLWDWRQDEIVRDYAEDRLVLQAAKRANIGVGTEEVQASMDELLGSMESQLQEGQTVQGILDQQGMVPSRLWMRVRREVLIRKLILADVAPKDWVRISTIIVRVPLNNTAELKKAADKADGLAKRLEGGESWDSVLGAAGAGGALGWRKLSAFPDSVQAEIARIGAGKYTQPAQTQNGIQIFRIEVLGAKITPEQRKELDQTVVAGRRTLFLKELRDKTKVEIMPVKRG